MKNKKLTDLGLKQIVHAPSYASKYHYSYIYCYSYTGEFHHRVHVLIEALDELINLRKKPPHKYNQICKRERGIINGKNALYATERENLTDFLEQYTELKAAFYNCHNQ